MSKPAPQDCLACKLVGTAALAGVGCYALYIQYDVMSEKLKHLSDRPFMERLSYSVRHGPRWLTVVSGAFFTLATLRLLTRPTATYKNNNNDEEKD